MARFTLAQAAVAVPMIGTVVAMADNWPAVRVFLIDLGTFLAVPQVEAMWMSLAISVAIGLLLPHLPQQIGMRASWPPAFTKARIRFWSCLLAIAICWAKVPTARGAWFALMTGFAAMGLWTTASNVIYRMFPCARPESLQPNDPPAAGTGTE
ncbi:hypothetical protein [Xanthomonas translucens]|uniref:hypothetical protein n=2 Tax=Xanthomonas campestris pv. translucens TaxID=343 RepID=UPI00071B5146|nr:hypothetical protein [Xanthomonas translucens]AVY67175.1 hypothetical protein NZ30_12845 [Xanthomonas translucens pv. undulosa]MCT8281767.1 hypothetical protein [Xanthomonas translucens pv. undulosa]MCT8316479.1 hypothetical protein [Xanthomonas translucens pv. undulosa]UKE38281.1 hypothetical protein KCU58_10935 [Xanthomonas translucens pv. undulosa]